MTKSSKLIALTFIPFVLCASTVPSVRGVEVPMVSQPSVAVYALNEAELQFHKARALSGDTISGYCLAMHFSFVDFRNPDTEYWITIAAENGDSSAMQIISIRLASRNNIEAKSRAMFWKERAAKIDSPPPKQEQCHKISAD